MAWDAVPLTGANQVIAAGPARYVGFALEETAGGTAKVRVWDHPSAPSGTLLDTITLAPGETARELYVTPAVANRGLYIEVVYGTVAGIVRVR